MKVLQSISDSITSNLTTLKPNQPKNIITNILNTNWDLTDDYTFFIYNDFLHTRGSNELNDENLQKSIISVEVPVLSSQEVDTVIGGIRRTGVKIQEQFRLVIKFRDFGGGHLKSHFTKLFAAQQYMYFDDIKSTIRITANNEIQFYSENCIITQISAQTYDNNNSNISDFDVTFISPSFTDKHIMNLGSDQHYAESFIGFDEDSGSGSLSASELGF